MTLNQLQRTVFRAPVERGWTGSNVRAFDTNRANCHSDSDTMLTCSRSAEFLKMPSGCWVTNLTHRCMQICPDIEKRIGFHLESCWASGLCLSGKDSFKTKMSMEHWWNGTGNVKQKSSEKDLYYCHWVRHKLNWHQPRSSGGRSRRQTVSAIIGPP